MCSLPRHTTSLLSGIASLECKLVKNANQGVELLFTSTEILADFLSNLYSNPWAKPPRAFGNLVEGDLLSNFGIQSLEHFCLRNWRKFILKRATRDGLGAKARASRDVAPRTPRRPAVPRLCAHAKVPGNPVVRGPRRRHCAPTANDAREESRQVPRGLCALAGGRTAIPHGPPVRRTSPPPPRPCLSSYKPWRCITTASTRHRAYKAPPTSFPHVPKQTL
jgi:hypothetical protein